MQWCWYYSVCSNTTTTTTKPSVAVNSSEKLALREALNVNVMHALPTGTPVCLTADQERGACHECPFFVPVYDSHEAPAVGTSNTTQRTAKRTAQ